MEVSFVVDSLPRVPNKDCLVVIYPDGLAWVYRFNTIDEDIKFISLIAADGTEISLGGDLYNSFGMRLWRRDTNLYLFGLPSAALEKIFYQTTSGEEGYLFLD